MSTKIGHFEILSELAKSATCTVYKANDPQTGQTVALKAIRLSAFGDHADALTKSLLEEVETTKVLSHTNLAPVSGAGEIDGQFCAAMEYIQGNSIATMLARKEGFSIWDLLDIGRQICSGLDHAHSHKVFHYSLEPAKIMCGWDGGVRVLSYGISSAGKFTVLMPGVPSILNYMSPEQVGGDAIDGRSNLYSLGAIFYEMVTDHKPFDKEDADSLRQSILESAPVPPAQLNPKLHPLLSDLIMKTLAKDPAERYQNGRELLDDLEKCKESKPQAAKGAAPVSSVVVPDAVKAANQAKFIGASAPAATKPPAAAPPASAKPAATPAVRPATKPAAAPAAPPRPSAPKPPAVQQKPAPAQPAHKKVTPPPATPVKTAAAAAGMGSQPISSKPIEPHVPAAPSTPSMSSAVLDEPAAEPLQAPQVPAPESRAPKIAIDPLMAEEGSSGPSVSFSDMTELPPLSEDYLTPPPPATSEPEPEPPAAHAPAARVYEMPPEKPNVQPREIAERAVKEIKNVPPRLIIYSIAGAAILILGIAVALVIHIQNLNTDGDTHSNTAESTPAETPQPRPVPPHPAPSAEIQEEPSASAAEVEGVPARPAVARSHSAKKKAEAPVAPVVVPGQMAIDSTPQGAQVQIDGQTDPSWVTPFTLSGLSPGQHSVTMNKAGYATDTRTVDVVSGSKSFVVTHLNQLAATLAVSSTPGGANIYIDGKDTGKVTPAQVAVTSAGPHVVLVRKSGYIDETTNAQFTLGQTVSFTPTLRALGNVDDIRTTGRMKKLFGGKDAQGMGTVSVRTQPKGAQVAINMHMMEKTSPVEVLLDPGNYIVDITLTGYAPIHKVISVDKGGKAVIDEVMQRE